ncbi:hypothetical protein [Tepidiphilus succinatimandens]|uniref:hypothetical protein n=1 Tax=Tepidiphilus succinatimandens TaxID=224436 RepID=UPI00112F20D4|nr:hypothetical protein [Tepidiphilus succinatimandens]
MLRLVLQLGLLAAGIGLAASNLDSQTMQKIASSIRDFATTLRQSGLPGGQEAASGMDKAADAVQSAAPAQANVTLERGEADPPPKAFYNKLPDECHWEKVIDPASGDVSCSVPERVVAGKRHQ